MRPVWIPKKDKNPADIESKFITVGYVRHNGVFLGKELSKKDIRKIKY